MSHEDPAHPSESTLPWWSVVTGTLLVASVAVACAIAVHGSCHDAAPPVATPVPGTPRAHYCDAVETVPPWVTLALLPTLVAMATMTALRGRPRLAVAAVATIILAAVTDAVLVASLEHSVTI